jgi:hypothetical protein
MKFCPECGSGLGIGSVKFCANCGKNLWQTSSNTAAAPYPSSPKLSLSDNTIYQDIAAAGEEPKMEQGQDFASSAASTNTVYSLGVKLEELVEKILKNKDYTTQRRQKLRGRSGALHEIDVLAKRKNMVMAVECKNYERNTVVGIKELRDFHSKLKDLHHNDDALFVTFGKFSSDSMVYANKYDIELWDGDQLSKIYLSMLIGRHATSTDFKEVTMEAALPVSMTYEEVTGLKLENPSSAKITGVLIFRPYYIFEYKLDSVKMDKRGKTHRVHEEDYCVVDAITEDLLFEDDQDDLSNADQILFSKKSKDEYEYEKALKKRENSQACLDLKYIKPKIQYKLQENPDYTINKLEPSLSMKTATYIILEEIINTNIKEVSYDIKTSRGEVEKKTMTIVPKKSDIAIKKSSLIYVPIWAIGIQSKDITYRRRAMAASKTMIVDELAICSKDFSPLKIWSKKKPPVALCETCGVSLCVDHICKNNEKHYCKDHSR